MRDTLADVFLSPADTADSAVFRVATVSATGGGVIEVSMIGQAGLSAAYLTSYTPVVADVVLVLQTKSDLIILGKIHTGG